MATSNYICQIISCEVIYKWMIDRHLYPKIRCFLYRSTPTNKMHIVTFASFTHEKLMLVNQLWQKIRLIKRNSANYYNLGTFYVTKHVFIFYIKYLCKVLFQTKLILTIIFYILWFHIDNEEDSDSQACHINFSFHQQIWRIEHLEILPCSICQCHNLFSESFSFCSKR